ncbi:unnamed protein product [Medioppia subpectinata]|uniref:Uncharacterized protein n=1 Tax=Medioppia subpectinata TaxID=1979941 RepID=A0A7R9KII6_9ACAR|nr:unnamed protein product [Medioppia subpectinata]CAG2103971.1 unnamed protein product [Medioppia subpectinata]
MKKVNECNTEEKGRADPNQCKHCLLLESQNSYLSSESANLKELNKELYEMDQKRQKYDIERQDYILRLLRTIKRLQLRSSRMISESESDCQSMSERQNNVRKSQPQDEEKERSLLQQSYENALKENVNLHKELEELRINFDNLIEELSKIESEHIQVLQMHTNLYKEDFDCERRQKENALNELQKHRKENESLRTICANYDQKLQIFVQLFKNQSLSTQREVKQSSSLTKVGVKEETNRTHSLPHEFRHKINKTNDLNKSQTNSQSNSEICKSDELLECPNCRILFPIQFHEQLLQHFEKCQRNI